MVGRAGWRERAPVPGRAIGGGSVRTEEGDDILAAPSPRKQMSASGVAHRTSNDFECARYSERAASQWGAYRVGYVGRV